MPRVRMDGKSAMNWRYDVVGLSQGFENRRPLTVCMACTKDLFAVRERYGLMRRSVTVWLTDVYDPLDRA